MLDHARERVGSLIGRIWAPAIAAIAKARRARVFHPVGLTFAATCEPVGSGELAGLGDELAGRVLVRCSAALRKRPIEYLDVLGIAMRFRPGEGPDLDERPSAADQDLLFATILSPLTMGFSLLATNAHDFLHNRYYAVAPFRTRAGRRVKLRLVATGEGGGVGSRDQRLRDAVAEGRAAFMIEARRTLHLRWEAIAHVMLEHEVTVAQDILKFDPFRDGASLTPVGLVHAIRRAAYPASQHARA
jgi:hypothetical protein